MSVGATGLDNRDDRHRLRRLVVTSWLIDKSALVRIATSPDGSQWASRVQRGLVRIRTVTRLEVGYSARSCSDLRHAVQPSPVSDMRPSSILRTGSAAASRPASWTTLQRLISPQPSGW